ncbi:hypothetical protein EJ04DRAFT_527096 [Polyplosphaeria fusca]|uniref:Uncharacterized protein n=1 Tax=Polyplosphaeria fusca TaxID=682080 RepID=A0A9P4UXF4_9PLEO|nr:hypothetical protein EJ04DRAFT_527096 [Polyplosphaeria fusca]
MWDVVLDQGVLFGIIGCVGTLEYVWAAVGSKIVLNDDSGPLERETDGSVKVDDAKTEGANGVCLDTRLEEWPANAGNGVEICCKFVVLVSFVSLVGWTPSDSLGEMDAIGSRLCSHGSSSVIQIESFSCQQRHEMFTTQPDGNADRVMFACKVELKLSLRDIVAGLHGRVLGLVAVAERLEAGDGQIEQGDESQGEDAAFGPSP